MSEEIREFDLGPYVPHSVGVGNAGKLWVTSDSKCVIRVNPARPGEMGYVNHSVMPQLSAGIMKDPHNRSKMWFAAPAPPRAEDPIVEMDTTAGYPLRFFPLEDDAKAQSIALETRVTGSGGTKKTEYSLLFAEPEHSYVGILDIPESGSGQIQRMTVEPSTWLWDVAVTSDEEQKKHTYWLTGQKRVNNPPRTVNGLFRREPGQHTWERIPPPRGNDQKPFYVKADTEAVWVTFTGPNQVGRFDLNRGTWITRDLGTAVPQQLAFTPNGEVWVTSSQGIHVFDSAMADEGFMVRLPNAGTAKGICVGSDGNIWYTNPTNKTLGRYLTSLAALGAPSLLGRTQVVSHSTSAVHAKEHVDRPLIAEYVAGGRPVPGIPLTCRVKAEGAAFDDGTQERIILTDQRGRVALPAVYAGEIEEEAVLSVGLGDTEPHAATLLHINPA